MKAATTVTCVDNIFMDLVFK